MNPLSQRIGLMVMAAATTFGLAVATAPAASAATVTAAPAAVAAAPWPVRWCKPAHTGRDWRWDDGRRGGHWDKREWSQRPAAHGVDPPVAREPLLRSAGA